MDISEALQNMGDEGIELSAAFNAASSKQSVVTTLYKAMRDGNLLENAREILSSYESTTQDASDYDSDFPELELKRVCWCLLRKDF